MTHTYGIQPVNEESIALAVSLIEQGEVVVIPTDTVYGVVAHPVHAQAVEKIFTVKHRPLTKKVYKFLRPLLLIHSVMVCVCRKR